MRFSPSLILLILGDFKQRHALVACRMKYSRIIACMDRLTFLHEHHAICMDKEKICAMCMVSRQAGTHFLPGWI